MPAEYSVGMVLGSVVTYSHHLIRDTDPGKEKDVYWNVGMSGKRIQRALNKWKVDALPDDLYRFEDVDDPDLALILKAFNIDIPPKLYRKAELKSIKTGTRIFM